MDAANGRIHSHGGVAKSILIGTGVGRAAVSIVGIKIVTDGEISLREAIHAANTDASVDGSTAGSGADTIEFAPTLFNGGPGTITLAADFEHNNQLNITEAVTINGPGADLLTIDAE